MLRQLLLQGWPPAKCKMALEVCTRARKILLLVQSEHLQLPCNRCLPLEVLHQLLVHRRLMATCEMALLVYTWRLAKVCQSAYSLLISCLTLLVYHRHEGLTYCEVPLNVCTRKGVQCAPWVNVQITTSAESRCCCRDEFPTCTAMTRFMRYMTLHEVGSDISLLLTQSAVTDKILGYAEASVQKPSLLKYNCSVALTSHASTSC